MNDADSDDEPLAELKKKAGEEELKPAAAEDVKMEAEVEVDLKWSTEPTLLDEGGWFVYKTRDDVDNLIEKRVSHISHRVTPAVNQEI